METIYRDDAIKPVLDHVAAYYSLEPRAMDSRSQCQEPVLARRVAIAVLRRLYPQASNRTIARMFGRDCHTWVIQSIQALNDLCFVNPSIAQDIQTITEFFLEQKRRQDAHRSERPDS